MAEKWREAKGLLKLREQVDKKWPDRSKESDGTIGDTAHASRASDHNPVGGVVHAMDITHDPAHGFDSYAFADALLATRDDRIKYVISNGRIGAGSDGPKPWVWRPYTSANKHDHHVHVSIKADPMYADNTKDWDLSGAKTVPDKDFVAPPPTLRRGSHGDLVKALQTKLGVEPDGIFGPKTEAALIVIQRRRHLVDDGICGPQTWAVINE